MPGSFLHATLPTLGITAVRCRQALEHDNARHGHRGFVIRHGGRHALSLTGGQSADRVPARCPFRNRARSVTPFAGHENFCWKGCFATSGGDPDCRRADRPSPRCGGEMPSGSRNALCMSVFADHQIASARAGMRVSRRRSGGVRVGLLGGGANLDSQRVQAAGPFLAAWYGVKPQLKVPPSHRPPSGGRCSSGILRCRRADWITSKGTLCDRHCDYICPR